MSARIELRHNGDATIIAFRAHGDAAKLLGPLDDLLRYDRHDRVFRCTTSDWPKVMSWCATRAIVITEAPSPDVGWRPQPAPWIGQAAEPDPNQVAINARGVALTRAMLQLARNRARLQRQRQPEQP
jgi:hypothetical protein